ncbi:unnamed protein product, partial [Ixodes hexagonus]
MLHDVSFWQIPLTDNLRIEIAKTGSAPFQNKDGPFGSVSRKGMRAKGGLRQLSKDWFFEVMPNGQKILRSWMVYSPVSGKLYCFCCRLFASHATETTSKFITGFQAWWKLNPKVQDRERSEEHLRCLEQWKTLEIRLRLQKTIDTEIIQSLETEQRKWRDILHRLLDITLFLAKQNPAFRGHREDELAANKGNFLEMVEMLSKYDPVLKEHMLRLKESTQKVKVSVSYLSPATQNEFIGVLARRVMEQLLLEIKSAQYYGIMFDSTPDISHCDQMAEAIRYVKIGNRKVAVKEVFLGFFLLKGKTASDLASAVLQCLERDGLDITMCRSQGYNNAANGWYAGGVQAIIKGKNKKAIFNGCVDHSLNLCGHHSFAQNTSCVTFFGSIEALFSFFAASTHRWDLLISHTGVPLKRLSATRWNAHYAAVKPVKEHFGELVVAMCEPQENVDTRGAAQCLLVTVCDFTFLCYLYLWGFFDMHSLLDEVNAAQLYLQTKGLSLDKVVAKLEAIKLFLKEERDRLVRSALEQALVKSNELGIAVERLVCRLKKRMAGEQVRDSGLSLQEENRRAMLECIDRFYAELQIRSKAMLELATLFGPLEAKSLL